MESLGRFSFHPHEHHGCNFPSLPLLHLHRLEPPIIYNSPIICRFQNALLDPGTAFPKEGNTCAQGKQNRRFLPPSPKILKAKPKKFNPFYGSVFLRQLCNERWDPPLCWEASGPPEQAVIFLNKQILGERSSCWITVLNQSDSLCWDLTGDHQ